MLALEIEWLTGVCVAARSPADDTPEWPVQPDRVFSALVATWGAHEEPQSERAALEWLESLNAPRIEAVSCHMRFAASAYVPPNDVATAPDHRGRQPRRFPSATLAGKPGEPHLRIVWMEVSPSSAQLYALQALARDTSYVGHSSALVRCLFRHFGSDASLLPAADLVAAPYRGRLAELERIHRRHQENADPNARPRPALIAAKSGNPPLDARQSLFGRDWIVLEHAGGDRPDLRAAVPVCRVLRDALMAAWENPIPEWLSGHAPNGAPSPNAHLAVVPLANVGFADSDGSLKGLALIVPRRLEMEWRADTPIAFENRRGLRRALSNLSLKTDDVELKLGAAGIWRLRPTQTSRLKSLDPMRYCKRSVVWSSATPIAMDRFPKGDYVERMGEAANIVAESCKRVGLPRPRRVRVDNHASIEGAPPVSRAPAWTAWARRKSLVNRPLFHATIEFADEVEGPVIVGAGRFFGLGLCLPVARGRST